ncbi:MAG: GNAT family N-acetyltransferase [Ilumatobacteraceae bacterium]
MDVDLPLVRRLETTAATAGLDLIDGIKALDPNTVAAGVTFGDGALIAMGPGKYVNRAVGITTVDLSVEDLQEIDEFFGQRRLPSMIELSSWAPPTTIDQLAGRGYTPAWFRSVFVLVPRRSTAALRTDLRIAEVGKADAPQWLDVFARGFEAVDGEARIANDEIGEAGRLAPDAHTFLVYLSNEVVGCGSVQVVDGVAWLGAAATLPAFRRRGVQTALVAHRLALAADLGCELAAVTALSNGPSARNIVRLGFQLSHTQAVVRRAD